MRGRLALTGTLGESVWTAAQQQTPKDRGERAERQILGSWRDGALSCQFRLVASSLRQKLAQSFGT